MFAAVQYIQVQLVFYFRFLAFFDPFFHSSAFSACVCRAVVVPSYNNNNEKTTNYNSWDKFIASAIVHTELRELVRFA